MINKYFFLFILLLQYISRSCWAPFVVEARIEHSTFYHLSYPAHQDHQILLLSSSSKTPIATRQTATDLCLCLAAECVVLSVELFEAVLDLCWGQCSPLVTDAVHHRLVRQDVLAPRLHTQHTMLTHITSTHTQHTTQTTQHHIYTHTMQYLHTHKCVDNHLPTRQMRVEFRIGE
jgi:hypothetical protein